MGISTPSNKQSHEVMTDNKACVACIYMYTHCIKGTNDLK